MKGIILPIETFDVTDENGARVAGTAEAYRDPKGEFYDPNSPYYQHPRFSNHSIQFLNDKDLCRIDRSVLSNAVQKALRTALTRFDIPDPSSKAIEQHVNDSIADALRACAPMSQVVPPAAPQEPRPNADGPQMSVLDAGAASPPSVTTAALASPAYELAADGPSQDKSLIRRLTRVRPS
ncbi:hypothetical protein PMI42_03293 [Bradyrhizobium sp. YR681]|uniref:hypothetical protein n=1 Tax=Bradyrhizobium sp. YR681 TaxID=1144344 RepID=UPI000271412A|nr:hypothetical protein [Bradyrhizobium sp. YR681]EJN13437.1 hypothetical protein PMI42_03293 [Bradyrhizobium sp. YR681]